MGKTEQRLQRAVEPRLEPGESFVAWSPAWVSRYRRYQFLLASRHRDYAVVTDRRLMLWAAGFFTRRPRRRVLAERLDELTIESISRDPGRRMACRRAGRRPLLLELGRDDRSDKFSLELRDRADAAAYAAKIEGERGTPILPAAPPSVAPAIPTPAPAPDVPDVQPWPS
ncbi:MAG: hypothetical protein JWL83_1295 [Actinomycetia bacterium]|nr:hypothetical protein [Actinomycetes bacterium]